MSIIHTLEQTKPQSNHRNFNDDQAWKRAEPQIFEFVDVAKKNAFRILIFVIVAAILAIAILVRATPRYVAYSQISLGEQNLSGESTFDMVEAQALSRSIIEGELAVLRSSEVLFRVAKSLELETLPEFNAELRQEKTKWAPLTTMTSTLRGFIDRFSPSDQPQGEAVIAEKPIVNAANRQASELGEFEAIVGVLKSRVKVQQLGDSFIVQISAESENAEVAAAIANALIDEYIHFLADKRFRAATRFTGWLETRVEELAEKLEKSERDVFEYRAEIESDTSSRTRLEQQMQELTEQLVVQRAKLAEAQAMLRKIRERVRVGGWLSAADVLNSPEIAKHRAELIDLRRHQTTLESMSGQNGSQKTSIDRTMANIENQIRFEVEREIQKFNVDVDVVRFVVESLEDTLKDVGRELLSQSNEEIKLNQLRRISQANQALYQEFLGRFKEFSELQNLETPDADVISFATIPNFPEFPRKKLSLLLAMIGGGLLGLTYVFLREFAFHKVSSAQELVAISGLNIFSMFPSFSRNIHKTNKETTHAALKLARNIDLQTSGMARSIIVSAPKNNAGKSRLAIALAQAEAKLNRKTIIIDADFTSARLSKTLLKGVPRANLLNHLYNEAMLSEAIIRPDEFSFDFLPTESSTSDPAILFDTERFANMITQLKVLYDVVILDAPASDDISKLFTYGGGIDIGILNIPASFFRAEDIKNAASIVSQWKVEHLGTVLTGAKNMV